MNYVTHILSNISFQLKFLAFKDIQNMVYSFYYHIILYICNKPASQPAFPNYKSSFEVVVGCAGYLTLVWQFPQKRPMFHNSHLICNRIYT